MKRTELLVLRSLFLSDKSVWRIIRENDLHVKETFSILKKFLRSKTVSYNSGKFHLTAKGKKLAAKNQIQKTNAGYSKLLKKFRLLTKNRPPIDINFWQDDMKCEDVVSKVQFMEGKGDLSGRSLLILGDDDFLSVAACLLNPKKVMVLEIDERIVNSINRIANENSFPLHAETYNAEQPLPKKFRKKFDTFLADPVEAVPGMELFLSRGALSLKGAGSSLYFGLTKLESSVQKWHKIEKLIIEMNLVITDALKQFSTYAERPDKGSTAFYNKMRSNENLPFKLPVPKVNWYASTMLRCEAAKTPKPKITGKRKIGKRMYVDNEIVTMIR